MTKTLFLIRTSENILQLSEFSGFYLGTDCKGCIFSGVLDIQAFERLLGPCKEILQRNVGKYAAELEQILSKELEE